MSFQPPPGGAPQPPPGQPYPPPQGYGGPPQPPWPQQPWSPGPPTKKRGNGWKWGLGAVALLAVIGVTAAVTISVTKDGSSTPTSPSGNDFGLASANDKGPANIITEDPSCAAWGPIQTTLADSEREWGDRDPSIPATNWTPEQRAQYEMAGRAMRNAADQTVALARLTPHRVLRELYEQFIAYARAYSDTIPKYSPSDNHLAGAATASSAALGYLCGAIAYSSAQARRPLVQPPPAPSDFAQLADPSSPQVFLRTPDSMCAEWDRVLNQFASDSAAWQALDASIPASKWTPEQRAVVDSVIPLMQQYADNLEKIGRSSTNPTTQDFAVFAAQYRRAYAAALPTYNSADSYLSRTSAMTASLIYEACKAPGG